MEVTGCEVICGAPTKPKLGDRWSEVSYDCALLALTGEAVQHIVNSISDAAKNVALIIIQKKTELLNQTPPQEACNPSQISIEDTKLNAVKDFTNLGSVISNDATVSNDLDDRLSRASSSFGRLSKRVLQSHSLRLSSKIQVYRAIVIPTLLYGAESCVLYRK